MEFPFWNIVICNAVVASLLAAVAIVIRKTVARPRLEHFVWLLVLVKLFTPPVFNFNLPGPKKPAQFVESPIPSETIATAPVSVSPVVEAPFELSLSVWLLAIWALGCAAVFTIYMTRSVRLGRLIASAGPADADLKDLARQVAVQLGMRRLPRIRTTGVSISPLVCWQRGRSIILLPSRLLESLDIEAQRSILAHELVHIKRRDHYVRLLEAFATICFWWHPVAWIARRNLRECGELCCDAHVLTCTNSQPRVYVNALFETMEWLSQRGTRVTWSATAATGNFQSLTRRFQMLTRSNRSSRYAAVLSLCVAAVLTATLGLGVVVGQEGSAGKTAPPAGKPTAGKKLWTMNFKITETDSAGKQTVLWSPKIQTPSDASVRIEGDDRKIEVYAKPLKDTNPQQWQVEFKLKEKDRILASPKLIVIDEGTVEMETTVGEKDTVRRLTFAFNVKR